jgi:fructose-bisphosphate aldolase class 1
MIQRKDTATQESLNSLRKELRALHKLAVRSEKAAKQIQNSIEQSLKDAAQQNLSCLTGQTNKLRKDIEQLRNLCKKAQSGQDQRLEEQSSELAKTNLQDTRQTLITLQDKLHEDTLQAQLHEQTLQAQQLHEDTLPTFIYGYKNGTDQD